MNNNVPEDDMKAATITPEHTKSTSLGYQTGIFLKAEKNTCIGYKSGFNTTTSNNILIGAEIDGRGNEIIIGDTQDRVKIGGYNLRKIIERIEHLEEKVKRLESDCYKPGGPVYKIAENSYSNALKDFDGLEK